MNSDSVQVIRCRAMYAGGGKDICRAQGPVSIQAGLSVVAQIHMLPLPVVRSRTKNLPRSRAVVILAIKGS